MTPPFAGFYFDCDSTLSHIEGVDELTARLSDSERVELRELTRRAMDGEMPLAQVYNERLGMVAPGAAELEAVGHSYIQHALCDAQSTIAALQFLGKHVGIVSGGLHQPVLAFGQHLGVAPADIHAVPVLLDAQGQYEGFDRRSPLWENQGKIRIMDAIPSEHRPVVFIGDGITDLETKDHVDLFVGFGGVERRAQVEAEADIFVTAPRLAAILPHTLSQAEQDQLAAHPQFADLLA